MGYGNRRIHRHVGHMGVLHRYLYPYLCGSHNVAVAFLVVHLSLPGNNTIAPDGKYEYSYVCV